MKENKTVWPGWETVRRIGTGSYGAVYEIERDVFGHKEKAALKVITIPQSDSDIEDLRSDGYDEESITTRFEGYLHDIVREYSMMSDMKGCANIVYCDDVKYIQHDDGMGWDIFIKMELLTALPRTLGKTVTDEQVIRIGMDICNALAFCEKRNVLHRDIKPQNIFAAPDGTYKLGDFGIAKTAERTTSGTKTGTYKYMAPEVYNNQPYGGKADIYSLGLVLYWLLNERRTPFLPLPPTTPTSTEEDRARTRRFSGEPIPAPVHGSNELKRIVLKACSYDPRDRYQSAAEMLAALDRLGQGEVQFNPGVFVIANNGIAVDSKDAAEPKTTPHVQRDESHDTVDAFWRDEPHSEETAKTEKTEGNRPLELFNSNEKPVENAKNEEPDDIGTVGAFNRKELPEKGPLVKEEPQPRPPKSQKRLAILVCVMAVIALMVGLNLLRGRISRQTAVRPAEVTPVPAVTPEPTPEPTPEIVPAPALTSVPVLLWQDGTVQYELIGGMLTISGTGTVRELNEMLKSDVTQIVIKSGIESIESRAFKGCTAISEIAIPDSVKSIGQAAFSGCTNLQHAILPTGLTIIESYLFKNCKNLQSILIPLNIEKIGVQAFQNCSCLTGVALPNGVKRIEANAFQNCTNLQYVYIPTSVEFMSVDAYNNCSCELWFSGNQSQWNQIESDSSLPNWWSYEEVCVNVTEPTEKIR